MDRCAASQVQVTRKDLASLAACCVSSEHAALTRAIGNGLRLSMHLANEPADLILCLSESGEDEPKDILTLSGDAGQIEFFDGRRLFRALSGIDYQGNIDLDASHEADADPEKTRWLGSAILGRLAHTPFAAAQRLDAGTARLHEAIPLKVILRSSQHAIITTARADAKSWHRFLDHADWKAIDNEITRLARLPIRHRIRVASHRFDTDVLASVSEGDICVPERSVFDCEGNGAIRIGILSLSVQYLEFNQLKVISVEGVVGDDLDQHNGIDDDEASMAEDESAYRRAEPPPEYDPELLDIAQGMADDDDDDDDDEDDHDDIEADNGDAEIGTERPLPYAEDRDPADAHADSALPHRAEPLVSGIPVKLSFELGYLSLTVAQLANIGPNVILEIEGGSPASILISCSGKRLGSGEIVDVGGKLGIRITSWEQKC